MTETNPSHNIVSPFIEKCNLQIDFSATKHKRLPHPNAKTESTIEETWNARRSTTANLFNASKFRFANVTHAPTSTPHTITLHLGLTDYKTYIGTHFPVPPTSVPFPPESLARPLGNLTILQTADDKTVLLVRSAGLADCPGALASPGGHAEPSELPPSHLHASATGHDAVVARLLVKSARDEVLEETFLSDVDVCKPSAFTFLGLVERTRDRKVSMAYYAQAFVTGRELERKFAEANVTAEESERLVVVPIQRLWNLHRCDDAHQLFTDNDDDMTKRLTIVPELVGAAELWRQMMANTRG